MAMTDTLPPIPEGYQLDNTASSLPPIPEGYQLDTSATTDESSNGGVLSKLLTHYLNDSMQKGQSLNDALLDLTPAGAMKNLVKGAGAGIENRLLGVTQTILPKSLQPEGLQSTIDQNVQNSQNAGMMEKTGQIVGDPLNFIPGGAAKSMGGAMLQGAKLGGLSGLTAPTTEQDTGFFNTLKNTAEGAAGGAIIPPVIAGGLGTAKAVGGAALNPLETGQAVANGIGGIANAVQHPIDTAVNAYKAVTQPLAEKMSDIYLNYKNNGNGLYSPFSQEGQDIEKKVGINFDLGQLTGNERALTANDYLSKSVATADKMYELQKERINGISDYFNNTLDNISKNSTSSADIGQKIADAHTNAIDQILELRSKTANANFKVVDLLNNNQPSIKPVNFVDTLQDFVDQSKSIMATKTQETAAKEAQDYINKLTDSDGQVKAVSARDMQNALQTFGDAASGSGNIWKDISIAADKRFAKTAFGALNQDLDESANSMSSPAAKALQLTRQRYADDSQKLNDINNTVIGRYLSTPEIRTPERIAEQIQNMRPTEVSQLMDVMDKGDPAAAQDVRRYFIESALDKAKSGMNQPGVPANSTYPYEPNKFYQSLPDKDTLQALFKNDPKALNEINTGAQALYRTAILGPGLGSNPIFNRKELSKLFQHGVGQPVEAVKDIARFITSSQVADILSNPANRVKFTAAMKQPNKPESQRVIADIYKRVVPGAVQYGILQGQSPVGVSQYQQQ